MNNYLNRLFFLFFLYIGFQIYNSRQQILALALAIAIADPPHYSRMRNNMLRLYVYNYPTPLRKKVLNKCGQAIGQIGTALNLYIMDVNGKYYSLSEEDRTIIETAISFLY
jgi:hypothetical protein